MREMKDGVIVGGSSVPTVEDWLASNGQSVRDDARREPYEFSCEVLLNGRLAAMRRLVNAWEWNGKPGENQGGHNPHRHPEGWVMLWRPGADAADFVFVVVQGPSGQWYTVKCEQQEVTAAEFKTLTGRDVPRRFTRRPGQPGRFEIAWTMLEPLECVHSGYDGDEAVKDASNWASELRTVWECEEEGSGWERELSVDPERMEWLRNTMLGDSEQLLTEILDRVCNDDELAKIADES